MRELEAHILRELRLVTGIRGLRQKDIQEWSAGKIKGQGAEVIVRLPNMGVNVAYLKPVPKDKAGSSPTPEQEANRG